MIRRLFYLVVYAPVTAFVAARAWINRLKERP